MQWNIPRNIREKVRLQLYWQQTSDQGVSPIEKKPRSAAPFLIFSRKIDDPCFPKNQPRTTMDAPSWTDSSKDDEGGFGALCSRCVPCSNSINWPKPIIRDHGAIPTFLGYQGFPASICTMLNSEIVHGIPDSRRLQVGDLLSIDGGVTYQGLIADAAQTIIVGGDEANPERARFSQAVKKALHQGCAVAKAGNTLGDIGFAIESSILQAGYALAKEYTGHGVGRNLHEDPTVFNYGTPGQGIPLVAGMTLAIEPIVTQGSPRNRTLSDGWTVVTIDGQDACQWEHCGVVTEQGFDIFA